MSHQHERTLQTDRWTRTLDRQRIVLSHGTTAYVASAIEMAARLLHIGATNEPHFTGRNLRTDLLLLVTTANRIVSGHRRAGMPSLCVTAA